VTSIPSTKSFSEIVGLFATAFEGGTLSAEGGIEFSSTMESDNHTEIYTQKYV
jgi:hypothetical protein